MDLFKSSKVVKSRKARLQEIRKILESLSSSGGIAPLESPLPRPVTPPLSRPPLRAFGSSKAPRASVRGSLLARFQANLALIDDWLSRASAVDETKFNLPSESKRVYIPLWAELELAE